MNEIYIAREVKNLGHNNAAALIKKAAVLALDAEKKDNCVVSVMLTDDEGIRELNREFRNIDAATDVLSFPMGDVEPETGKTLLGDMMINIKRCEQQGEEFGHGFEREIMYLTVHSILHLLGYDHVDEGPEKALMRKREKEIMGDEN